MTKEIPFKITIKIYKLPINKVNKDEKKKREKAQLFKIDMKKDRYVVFLGGKTIYCKCGDYIGNINIQYNFNQNPI